MSARQDILSMKKQALEADVNEEDKHQIFIYFRHRLMSLIKLAEEKLLKHNALPKSRKKKPIKPTKGELIQPSEVCTF